MSAASFSGRKGEIGHAAYFTKISYKQLSSAAVSQLSAEASPVVSGLLKGKDVFRVDLTIDTGQVVSMAAIGPSNEIFWVFPLVNNKLGPAGFYVASLDYVNRKR